MNALTINQQQTAGTRVESPDGPVDVLGSGVDSPVFWRVDTLVRYQFFLPAPLAQLAEQLTLNQRVGGSSPSRRTMSDLRFCLSPVDLEPDRVAG